MLLYVCIVPLTLIVAAWVFCFFVNRMREKVLFAFTLPVRGLDLLENYL